MIDLYIFFNLLYFSFLLSFFRFVYSYANFSKATIQGGMYSKSVTVGFVGKVAITPSALFYLVQETQCFLFVCRTFLSLFLTMTLCNRYFRCQHHPTAFSLDFLCIVYATGSHFFWGLIITVCWCCCSGSRRCWCRRSRSRRRGRRRGQRCCAGFMNDDYRLSLFGSLSQSI